MFPNMLPGHLKQFSKENFEISEKLINPFWQNFLNPIISEEEKERQVKEIEAELLKEIERVQPIKNLVKSFKSFKISKNSKNWLLDIFLEDMVKLAKEHDFSDEDIRENVCENIFEKFVEKRIDSQVSPFKLKPLERIKRPKLGE